ncbi:SGNH/GDSL hydrolase family protein [Polaribacter sargassicola]|uniref:SGNH/GDSL hydrolase family protein n=1 Tax=Polaribacter sargassicola TaxID=2836891 RepID=UPI001F1D0010|nr:SGNH/GDSL hydrolase family protein [Polaribacter sp. DS7-9]MCG1035793.1 SGNH/GDSL hydrolase family protein [Polaribacter sp. DS7-9]
MKKIVRILLLFVVVITTIAFSKKKQKVLIVGDSISIGYTPFVKESLKEVAEVVHNPGNAKHTGNGLKHIEDWIGDEQWDIIHFNWGLWDLCYRHPDSKVQGQRDKANGTITFSIEDYERNLRAIVKKIKQKSNAKLIFVTTSYVPTKEAGRYVEDAIKYNKVARKVMQENDIEINDIYKVSKKIHQEYGKGNDDVHYTPKGYEELGKHITKFLEKKLK